MFMTVFKVITNQRDMRRMNQETHEPRIMINLLMGHLTAKKNQSEIKNLTLQSLHSSITCHFSLVYFFHSSEIFYSSFIN